MDAEYLQQLCAEQLVTRRDRNGFPMREWQKLRERNESLDILVYCRAAASAAGLDRFEERHWQELERQLGITAQVPLEETPHAARARDDPDPAGVVDFGSVQSGRRVIKSRWLSA